MTDQPVQAQDEAYPRALRDHEEELIARRRRNGEKRCTPRVGLALSGGGIRSATFSFGFLQALAGRNVLGEVDLLSTVSGGGYTGGMLTRLFSRERIENVEDVERLILPESAAPAGPESGQGADGGCKARPGSVLRWLRENGHHLAPNGSGDLLLGGAVIFRNWLSLHIVLVTLLLAVFVAMHLARWGVDALALEVAQCAWPGSDVTVPFTAFLSCQIPIGQDHLWWSPWTALAALLFVLWPAPCGLAYWLMPSRTGKWYSNALRASVVLAGLVAGVCLLAKQDPIHRSAGALAVTTAFGITAIGLLVYIFARRRGRCSGTCQEAERLELSHRLSFWLKCGLVAFAALAGLAVVDTLGQTVYLSAVGPDSSVPGAIGSALAAIAAFAEGGRRLVVRFRGDGESQAPRLPQRAVAAAVAVIILLVFTVTANALSHALAWDFKRPKGVPAQLETRSCDHRIGSQCDGPAVPDSLNCSKCTGVGDRSPLRLGVYLLLFSGLSLVFGRGYRFLNDSTLQPLYRARIVRAYLGASNPSRIGPGGTAVTEVIAGDDGWMDWDQAKDASRDPLKMYCKGAPLHLINVTINETTEGKSGLHRRDRRGIGMAVGPAGISAGVRHHVVFCPTSSAADRRVCVFPEAGEPQADSGSGGDRAKAFRMFEYADEDGSSHEEESGGVPYGGESLTFGQWLGISGAAFSTGIGMRTNFALSFLAGILNVRLGYWWDSGVGARGRHAAQREGVVSSCFARLLPVQSYLWDELFAKFRGVDRRRWNLSDGGHFENLGAYELIRRRVPLILIVDAEADPDYGFEGLANLVRKARADFGAEIDFLDRETVCRLREERGKDAPWLQYAGSLDMLRRGSWGREPEPCEDGPGTLAFSTSDRSGLSLAHIALATVRYADGGATSRIVYIKPTLIGDESADLRHYHEAHPDFPQQTTKDQFFDEAQWESYRALGERIGLRCLPAEEPFTSFLGVLEEV